MSLNFQPDLGIERAPTHAMPLRVTYQDSCHLLHGQQIREAAQAVAFHSRRRAGRDGKGRLLLRLHAGSYNVTETQASLEILSEKMKNASATGAPGIVTPKPGCLLQMRWNRNS